MKTKVIFPEGEKYIMKDQETLRELIERVCKIKYIGMSYDGVYRFMDGDTKIDLSAYVTTYSADRLQPIHLAVPLNSKSPIYRRYKLIKINDDYLPSDDDDDSSVTEPVHPPFKKRRLNGSIFDEE